jgi:hypothetical protein
MQENKKERRIEYEHIHKTTTGPCGITKHGA